MAEIEPVTQNPEPQVTLMHLLMGIALFMPVAAMISGVKATGGSIFRYVVGVPLALLLGLIIVVLDWKIGKVIWLQSQKHSGRIQNIVAVSFYALLLFWIVVAVIAGDKLASFVTKHLV